MFPKEVIRFFIYGLLLYLGWEVVYQGFLSVHTSFNFTVIDWQVRISWYVLDFFGYTVYAASGIRENFLDILWIEGSTQSLEVMKNCNAVELIVIFSIFLLAFPSKWKDKWWIIPGSIVLFLLNIVRIIVLVIIEYKAPEYMDFNHKYTFTALMYLVIFGFWFLWLKKTSGETAPA
ncbi:MAG: archaeosortase/exosortase family protein [Bacteroidota bacterium]